jgi:thiamine phosphate synthase YjbQ (UPF0047 family)
VCRDVVRLRTEKPLQFVDLTALVAERVRRSGIRDGTITIQSRHTTAAVVVNENEPLLIEDFEDALERWAPQGAAQSACADSGAFPELLSIYHLFGDPALRIR